MHRREARTFAGRHIAVAYRQAPCGRRRNGVRVVTSCRVFRIRRSRRARTSYCECGKPCGKLGAATVPLCGLRLRSCALTGNPLCCAAPFYRTDKSKQEPRRPGFDKPGQRRFVCRRPCKPARRHTVPAIPADGVAWRVSLVCVRSIMAITSKEDIP